ncbi:universal stress protein MSMEG_3950/MSMEI_3859-like [Ostrea edulis]|uniref:universal stress protein MSMEG_3950/MSMEI_3859-like n=1 Tax=Ostrea edulis TaxID=37623 RepID=UPI0020943CD1|nr:universal stress protein MSMEG_3950/MSMEI_3859-like [Ostrea edulis]
MSVRKRTITLFPLIVFIGSESSMATVVVAVDESKFAENAFRWYAANIHKPTNRVILLHAMENIFVPEMRRSTFPTTMSPGRIQELQKEAEEKSAALKKKFVDMAASLGVNAEVRIEKVDGKPEYAIVDVASQENAGCIVTGTRGMGVIRRTILGSTSDFILHHASCPVVVCKLEE